MFKKKDALLPPAGKCCYLYICDSYSLSGVFLDVLSL